MQKRNAISSPKLTNAATTTSTTTIFYLKAITITGDCTVSQIIDDKREKEKGKRAARERNGLLVSNAKTARLQYANGKIFPSRLRLQAFHERCCYQVLRIVRS